ncbi:MAG TPA: GH-E family nuclease [Glycomyces sp.]|nr:GH-E family nuclease [Glycomyces sp.]
MFKTGKGGGKKPDLDPDVKPKKKRKRKRKSVADDPYQRGKWRKNTNDDVSSPDGKVRDPLTNKVMDKDKPWDVGQEPGHEYRKHKKATEQHGPDTYPHEDFLDDYTNPDHLRRARVGR